MIKLAIAAILLFGCVAEDSDSQQRSPTFCGTQPKFPALSPSFEQDRASFSMAEYDALIYYLGINAFWTECILDGGIPENPPAD